MHDIRLHKYYYQAGSGYSSNSLIYRFLVADRNLRRLLNLSSYCGAVTVVTFIFAAIMAFCSIAIARQSKEGKFASLSLFRQSIRAGLKRDQRISSRASNAARTLIIDNLQKLPRMESVVNIIPPYKCIHKHLQRMSVFQEKTQKILRKEQLELEIMNSKASCIKKLLKLEEQSEWRRSRSPKVYHRPISAETSK
ncbi:uncharacterized protein LOC113562317 [Ooceraea biroi]|uniref:uncharacterized protein LOC113562317 n=1 Tax=Ooceraea biroi TaxID=2015173 RepID=UPI000F07899B|nr:uncharacterized protein LOC113562317 [Ooceraea biroi]